MFESLRDKLSSIVGDEAGRQNAIARFGTGIAVDGDNMITDPRDPTKKMPVDDFSKLPAADQLRAMAPGINRMGEIKQIRPEDLGVKEMAELVKSSFSSKDNIGRQMRGDQSAEPSAVAAKAASLSDGPLFALLRGTPAESKTEIKNKMRPA